MSSQRDLTVVVPTIGLSSYLDSCLQALASAKAAGARVYVAAQASTRSDAVDHPMADRVLTTPAGSGFAEACNLALAAVGTEYVAIINDDAIVEHDWSARLLTELKRIPTAAAAQGLNLKLEEEPMIDGCGIAWNKDWQAVQIGHGGTTVPFSQSCEVFGVSGTAAMFRIGKLQQAALNPGSPFDAALHTYYEDVDLACRLQGLELTALYVDSARARHAGGISSRSRPVWRYRHIYGNRWLVLARLLGAAFKSQTGRILRRDLLDLAQAGARLDRRKTVGIIRGWKRASALLQSYRHQGAPLVSMTCLNRFRPPTREDGRS